jgi:hypothetical protein
VPPIGCASDSVPCCQARVIGRPFSHGRAVGVARHWSVIHLEFDLFEMLAFIVILVYFPVSDFRNGILEWD